MQGVRMLIVLWKRQNKTKASILILWLGKYMMIWERKVVIKPRHRKTGELLGGNDIYILGREGEDTGERHSQ